MNELAWSARAEKVPRNRLRIIGMDTVVNGQKKMAIESATRACVKPGVKKVLTCFYMRLVGLADSLKTYYHHSMDTKDPLSCTS